MSCSQLVRRRGSARVRQSAPEHPLPLAGLTPAPVAMPTIPQGTDVHQITLQPLHGLLVYRIETEDGVILSDAVTGAPIGIGDSGSRPQHRSSS